MAVKVTTEPREHRQLAVTIEVDQARVDQELRKAARNLARDYNIPGFRKGKAPYHIIVQYFGEQALYQEFLDKLGQEVYDEALKQEGIKPYAQAALEDLSLAPLTYRLLVPLEPEIDMGDYRSLRVEPDPIEVDEAQVEELLARYQVQHTGWAEVSRPSQYGDLLRIDVRSVIRAESEGGDEIVVLDETDWDVVPDQENPMEPPGFDEALLGMTAGEEKEFDLSWPVDGQSIYAGKTAHFRVKLHQIQAFGKPELNDEFAQLVGEEFSTLDALKENIRKTMQAEAAGQAEDRYQAKVLDALRSQSRLDYPPVVVEDQIDSMVNEFAIALRRYGIDDIQEYFANSGQSLDDYRESLRGSATSISERNLIISELLKTEGITVSDAEYDERLKQIVADAEARQEPMGDSVYDAMREGIGRSLLEARLLTEKTLARLVAIARGEPVPEPGAAAETPAASEPAAVGEAAAPHDQPAQTD